MRKFFSALFAAVVVLAVWLSVLFLTVQVVRLAWEVR